MTHPFGDNINRLRVYQSLARRRRRKQQGGEARESEARLCVEGLEQRKCRPTLAVVHHHHVFFLLFLLFVIIIVVVYVLCGVLLGHWGSHPG
jgi:hypothetical protein